ncbi:hypothetical protein [Fructobacillus cardui]|uniref:hypothetical protein n=1 Tax=Fructobacillus cardui TaxID=2893170 RepID=UPI0030C849A6
MMGNRVYIQQNQLVVEPVGLNKLTTLKTHLIFPITHVPGASLDSGILADPKGLRVGGTHTANYWGGSFHQNNETTFYNVKANEIHVVIQLQNEKYDRLVLGVKNPKQLVQSINNQL